jgi:predicted kinase
MIGYPGAGKTTVARLLHELTGAEHLWADHTRKHWFQKPTYSQTENTELYDKLNQQTDELLAAGKSVIFDTNFNFYKDRQKLRYIAANHGAQTVLLWVQTPVEIAKQRATIEAHKHDSRVFGNMTEQDFERLRSHLEEPKPEEQAITIDGTKVSADYLRSRLFKN